MHHKQSQDSHQHMSSQAHLVRLSLQMSSSASFSSSALQGTAAAAAKPQQLSQQLNQQRPALLASPADEAATRPA
jgi:hypothetical protein